MFFEHFLKKVEIFQRVLSGALFLYPKTKIETAQNKTIFEKTLKINRTKIHVMISHIFFKIDSTVGAQIDPRAIVPS